MPRYGSGCGRPVWRRTCAEGPLKVGTALRPAPNPHRRTPPRTPSAPAAEDSSAAGARRHEGEVRRYRRRPSRTYVYVPSGNDTGPGGSQPPRISRARRAVSDGVLPTLTPAASRASFFAWAVPEEPETMAPAWPMVLPSGAVKPAT